MKPNLSDAYPDAIFDIDPGTKKGEIFLGPDSLRINLLSSIVPKPPIPDPMATPALFGSVMLKLIPASSMHCCAAINPY